MAVIWNANYELTPLPQDSPTGIDDEVRALKDSISARMKNEHETFETDNSSGAEGDDFVHKAGSAKVYYQATAPTLRPDGVTALDSEDAGRMWIDSDDSLLYSWSGSAWVEVKKVVFSDAVTFNEDITQAWGYEGCLNKPATTSGTTSILYRADGGVDGLIIDNWKTHASWTAKFDGSITIYWEACRSPISTRTDDYWLRILKNSSTIWEIKEADTTSYTAYSVTTTVSRGDVIYWQTAPDFNAPDYYTTARTRHHRIMVDESITLTAWEKYWLGLTG